MENKRIGFAITGSFCTFAEVLPVLERLCARNEVTAILSPAAASFDTRFYKAADFRAEVLRLTGKPLITTIVEAEPVGPQKLFDILLIAPCTGNTLAKLALNITDTPVVMAAKSHVRNDRPLVLAPSTNDALYAAAPNIGELLTRRNYYFVPYGQDNSEKKPRSMAAKFVLCEAALDAALEGKQLQPLIQ
ncbi:MAG: dipicolinate synthase subunit B [Clostridiaceae bacterium]|nr:dipicolinate synthase subunit B [Clostridiaceae bacterium]